MNNPKKFKAFSLMIMLFTAVINFGQTPSSLQSFPATDLGQSISLTPSDPSWAPLWEAANASRVEAQTLINTGQSPLNKEKCHGNVCCETLEFWSFTCRCWVFVTKCKVDGVDITPIVQYE